MIILHTKGKYNSISGIEQVFVYELTTDYCRFILYNGTIGGTCGRYVSTGDYEFTHTFHPLSVIIRIDKHSDNLLDRI